MSGFLLAAASAVWFGILTSVSPCPLATNVAAISYISRRVSRTRQVVLAGLLYTLGRTLTYVVLGALLVSSAHAIPAVSHFLQRYMNIALGPILILAGMFLLELLSFKTPSIGASERLARLVEAWGVWSPLALGALFAVSFCPVSAAWFFGSLITLAVKFSSRIVLPLLFGVGTALPVLAFAAIIAFSAQAVGKAFEKVNVVERWARRVTGVVFILIGVYFCMVHIFCVLG